jgi:ribokinase
MPSTQKPVVVVGSINTDLVVTATRLPEPGETITGHSFATFQGGKGANQAVAAALLGARTIMIGKVGCDDFGLASLASLKQKGVECEHVLTEPGDSGIAVITVGEGGRNSIVVVPGANAHVTPEFVESQRDVLRAAGIVLAQLEIPLATVLRLAQICHEEAVPFMLDPAPAVALPPELLALCTWLTPNETEAAFYTGDRKADARQAAEALHALGASSVLLKLGEAGAYVSPHEGLPHTIAPVAATAVDTTAAGDTFNGAFAAALIDGREIAFAGAFAATAAALSVTRAGAQTSMPNLREVLERMRKEL